MKISPIILFAVILSSVLVSCSTSTKITAHWADKDYVKGNINKILIMGITPREAIRRSFEQNMSERLEAIGVMGIPSSEVFPMKEKLDTTTFRLHFSSGGYDAVISCQLVSEDRQQHYQPSYGSSYGSYGGAYNRGFYGHYGSSWDYMYSPGYSYTTSTLKIETNVYDTKSEKLIWTGLSDTFDPSNEIDAIQSLNRKLVYELDKQGYFRKEME